MSAMVARGGIDLGGTKIQAVVVDGRWNVLGQSRRPTPTKGGPGDVAEQMAEALREAALEAGVRPSELAGGGVGSPGDVNEATGAVSQARNLPGWDGTFQLGKWLAKSLGTPISVGNDVQVATNAEARLGAGRHYKSLLGVFWGTGVGGGIILNGEPWLGRGAAGEIGHMVVKQNGARCTCGRRGCLEAYAGRAAMEIKAREEHEAGKHTDLFKIMKKHGHDRLTSGIWERALKAKDPLAEKLIDRAVAALGAGIASAINLIDVEAVIIGGGLGSRFGEPFVKRIRQAMAPHLFTDDHPPALHVAGLGDLGGAIGAALLSANSEKGQKQAAQIPLPARRIEPARPVATASRRVIALAPRAELGQRASLGARRARLAAQHRRRGPERVLVAACEGGKRLQRFREEVAQPVRGRTAAKLHHLRARPQGQRLDALRSRVRPDRARATGPPRPRPASRCFRERVRRRARSSRGASRLAPLSTRRAGAPASAHHPRSGPRSG